MARRVILSDDFTGQELDDVKTHIYMVDNVYYEVDFGTESFAKFEKAIAEFVKVSRETRRISATSKPEASHAERIRQWAVANGMDVSERGRLSAEVIAAYEKANGNGSESNSQTETDPDETDSPGSNSEASQETPENGADANTETPNNTPKPRASK